MRSLSKSKLLRILVALCLVQTTSFASFSGTEEVNRYGLLTKPAPPSSGKLIYVIMDVVDKIQPADQSWKDLLFKTDAATYKVFKEERLQLRFQEESCTFGPLCDTVNITKDKDAAGVVWYHVYIRCRTHFDDNAIDAEDPQDVAQRIAWFIAKHDARHVVKNER